MIVIRVERWKDPHAKQREVLGTLKIAEDPTSTEEVGNFEVTVGQTGKTTRSMRVEGHRRAGGIWLLAFDVLKQLVRPTVAFSSGAKPSVPPKKYI
jgi:hypothetical protein